MNKNNVYSYEIDGKLYINLTNKCTNACSFCVRQKDTYEGYFLWLDNEPSVLDVINSVQDLDKYAEVVFCGYGEPTFKIAEVVELAKYFKSKGKITRLNTNGHGSKINGRDISSDLIGAIDVVSISLNQSDAKKYQQI
ncbi:MAG: TatD family nuclease-associated radical SAM protein [Clostridia bacterium]|nr:TatD family nuclease-associated radical SAM protein [Clostridia bacterium]